VNLIAATMPLKWAPGRGASGDSTLRPTPSVTDGHAWHGDSDGPHHGIECRRPGNRLGSPAPGQAASRVQRLP
jgi:hypothetical protein